MTEKPSCGKEGVHGLKTAVSFAHTIVAEVLEPGETAIDATLGNGLDTIFLARHTGRQGTVFAFDVQPQAHRQARMRIFDEQVSATIRLFKTGHERMLEVLPASIHGRVKAIMFNLGFLPGGDKSIITRPETTLPALDAGLKLLAPLGLITVVLYTGHAGGEEEAQAVEEWARNLDKRYRTVLVSSLNTGDAPRLIAVQRREAAQQPADQDGTRKSSLGHTTPGGAEPAPFRAADAAEAFLLS